ncbi:hypothetical protein K466DRAFT_619106 [Polyporus arcularius HHB13444]|uniref:RNase H type-1 domain-containing protein n=1 Tax=Polyporus arcularius HHB13444 TaxID=1314778 RepID=A0A5C3PUP9_9APHY|nr:hypothetical protein K466DRAFT_619106 [Polyporus arcularius HHB13444]
MEQSNQTGEIVATLTAATIADKRTRLLQVTDSQTTMNSLSKWRQDHEDKGYILQKNAALTQTTIARFRARSAHTILKWVKGHGGHPGNEAADKLAGLGAAKLDSDQINLTIPAPYRLTGAKLQAMTQKLAYQAISARKNAKLEPRPRTTANMERISSGIQAAYGMQIRDDTIWKSLRSKHVSRQASQYMWMSIHDGYMLGDHWLRTNMSDELRRREICAICGERESMSHIVFECNARGQEIIWNLLRQTWALTGAEWKEPCWGTVFGAACAVFKTSEGRRRKALESLWCILCTEALHLIWKIRCERVIQNDGEEHTESEITNRYYSTLNSRLTLDRRTAVIARGRKALRPQEVARIWLPVLDKADELPLKWVGDSGVLVGIKRGR